MNFAYYANGNIDSATLAGSYTYSPTKPHAVITVTNPDSLISSADQEIEYTSFNKVQNIIDGINKSISYFFLSSLPVKLIISSSGSNTSRSMLAIKCTSNVKYFATPIWISLAHYFNWTIYNSIVTVVFLVLQRKWNNQITFFPQINNSSLVCWTIAADLQIHSLQIQ